MHDQRRPAERADRGADAREVVGDEFERVVILDRGVHTERDHEPIGREMSDHGRRAVQGGTVDVPSGSQGEREVVGAANAATGASFGRETREERIFVDRVGMQRDEADVVAVIEDVLGAVAVVIVDVEDRDAGTVVGPGGRGDGGVVQKAVATVGVNSGMMTGGARQRVRGVRVPAEHRTPCTQRHVDGADRGRPRAGEDRVVVVGVPAEFCDGMRGCIEPLATDRACVRDGFGVLVGVGGDPPAFMCVFEELDVVGTVDPQHWFETVVVGGQDRADPGGRDGVADTFGAGWDLRRIDHVPLVMERLARVVLTVHVGREREHGGSCITRCRRPEVRIRPIPSGG